MAEGKLFDLKITGIDAMIQNIERISQALEDLAPQAITEAAEIPMAMMRRLVPVDTGKLQKSIRFELGRGGAAQTGKGSKRTQTLGGVGKTYVVGYIKAGDESTMVTKGKQGGKRWDKPRKGRGKGRRKGAPPSPGPRWQNAQLQEFGTLKMAAKPFFYVSWRANKAKTKKKIGDVLSRAFKKANKAWTIPQSEAA